MEDFNKQVCRLCLVISPTCECEIIDEIKREILEVLQINVDFDISNCAVACNRCLERLQDCFDFKSRIITILMDNIKKTSQQEVIGKSLCLGKLQVCWLCMSLIKEEAYNYTADLKGAVLLEDMIRNCFPEVDLNTHFHESHTCKQCVSSLERHYEFLKNCREVEQKIVHFCQVANHCTADKVNLEDMLKFKDYDMPSTPLIIKKECSDAENVDDNATKFPKSEDIASIKCEEIDIKDELDDEVETHDCGELRVHNSSGDSGSSKEATETRTSASKDNDVHGCTLCSFIANTRLSLQAHVTSHRGLTKKYGCPKCKYETDDRSNLCRHGLRHKDNSEVKMYKCDLCPFKTRYKDGIIKHQKVLHEVVYKFQCEKCPFKTKWRRSLKKHVMIHAVKHPYSCDQCPYSSNLEGNLLRHQLHHTDGAGQNKCNLCTYQAKSTKSVRYHVYSTHTELPKLKCAHCPYESVYKNNLMKHIQRSHIKDKPKLKCDLCNYVTTEMPQLRRHDIVHREATIQCYQCDFRTKTNHYLQKHMKLHRIGSSSRSSSQHIN